MRRADRLFDILQALRAARHPLTAAALAEAMEVSPRTIYRDVATLQARRIPIAGEAGVGYVLRPDFSLPPLNFTIDEIEAIAIAARMLARTGDRGMMAAAERVLEKVALAVPEALREHLAAPPVFVSKFGGMLPPVADLGLIRGAIRARRKLDLVYGDETGRVTRRRVWPVAVAYGVEATLLSAWCELRGDFRHFRADRIQRMEVLEERIGEPAAKLMRRWLDRLAAEETSAPAAAASRQTV